jgi:hypothetical protein
MLNRSFLVATTLLASTTLSAQTPDPQCPSGTTAQQVSQDACQKAIDLFRYLAPQLGTSIAGGNATLGQGGNLGGLGHFSAGLRVNAVQGSLPDFNNIQISTAGAQRSPAIDTKSQFFPMPAADLAIGIFKGVPLPLTNVGGVDLLVSAAYLPEFENSGVKVHVPNGSLKLGYGARVGILQESLLVPGLSVSYLRRDLPTVDLTAAANAGGLSGSQDSLYVTGLSLKTKALRLVASKSLLLFGLAAGYGRDTYESSASVRAHVAARPPFTGASDAGPVTLSQNLTRSNIFADVSMNLLLLKLTGEIGQVSGGTINTFNTFSGKQAADSRIYGSVGARFGF